MSFLSWLYPPICQGCGWPGQWLCNHCLAAVEFYPNPVVFDSALDQKIPVVAAGYFQPPLSRCIKALKYKGVQDIGTWLGQWLAEVAPVPEIDLITWVPLHPDKLKVRGFNQTELIARSLAQTLKLPAAAICEKLIATTPQAQVTNKLSRLHHLDGSFAVTSQWQKPKNLIWLKQQRILIVDDVITTGATLNCLGQLLISLDIIKVSALAVAHGQ
ncbi:MAG TPA: hypothetical protein DEP87_01400 [Candidatus Pacebacteria bacterium]|nr:hypothetical protein [Candidatus Paceibacterota bacterium]